MNYEIEVTVSIINELSKDQLKLVNSLQKWGLIPVEGTYFCPECNGLLSLCRWPSACDGFLWNCKNKIRKPKKKPFFCTKRVSLRKGTFFEGSKLSIPQILKFMYLWTHNLPTAYIHEETGFASETIADWSSNCREVVFEAFIKNSQPIGGPGKIVEIHDFFDQRKFNRGYCLRCQWVFGGLERESGKVFMIPVEYCTSHTLLKVIEKWILPGTTIYSDCWRAYNCLSDKAFIHLSVNHSLHFKEPDTNSIKATLRAAKRFRESESTSSTNSGNLAKYMFIKHCTLINRQRCVVLFELVGQLYSPLNSGSSVFPNPVIDTVVPDAEAGPSTSTRPSPGPSDL